MTFGLLGSTVSIVLQRQVVDASARGRDRALERRRVDGDAGEAASAPRRASASQPPARQAAARRLCRGPHLPGAAVLAQAAAVALPSRAASAAAGRSCQANSTAIESTMARMKLRLFSSMGLSAPRAASHAKRGRKVRQDRVRVKGFSAFCWGGRVHFGERAFKVLDQFGEASLYRSRPRDQDIIFAWAGAVSRTASFSRRRARLRTTALPNVLVAVKPKRARPRSTSLLLARARASSTSERRVTGATLDVEEFSAGLETSISVTAGQAAGTEPAEPACALWRGGARTFRPPKSPCGRENRGAVCGRPR